MNLLDRLAYDSGGYTVQEILSSFCNKILEIIDLVNKNEEVCGETHTILENIRNEVVPGVVDDIMKELQDDGYFDRLVNVTLIEQLRTELTTLLNSTITDFTTGLDNKANVSLVEQLRTELNTLLNHTITNFRTRLDNFDLQLNTITQEVEQLGNDKIPNEIFQVAVDNYIQNNNSGLVTQKKLNEFIIDSKNLIDTTKSAIGKFIWYADGRLGDSALYDTTDYIPILTGDKIAFSPKIRKLLEYNTSKTPITSTLLDELKENYVYTCKNDGYIRVTYFSEDKNKIQAEKNSSITSYEPYSIKKLENIKSINGVNVEHINGVNVEQGLKGKIGISFGDSIMRGEGNNGYGILDLLIRDYGCDGTDYGVSGASIQGDLSGYYHIIDQINSNLNLNTSPDFILIDGGSNDIASGRYTLGTVTNDFTFSSDNCTSITSSLDYIFGKLRTAFPSSLIIFIIVHSTPSRDFSKEKEVYDIIEKECEKWSVITANIFKHSGFNARITEQANLYTTVKETQTATHPNELGYIKWYIPSIVEILKNKLS